METQALPAEATTFATETKELAESYTGYKVENADHAEQGAADSKEIKKRLKALEDMRKSLTRPLDESKSRIMDFFRKPEEQLKAAVALIDRALLTYDTECRRIQEEERQRAEEAEAARIAAEAKELEAKAVAALASGNERKAERLVEKMMNVEAQPVAVRMAEIKHVGVSVKTYWRAHIVDVDLIPRAFMVPDEKKLAAMATATKGPSTIPGVEFREERGVAAR
jgi:hypothetical protein